VIRGGLIRDAKKALYNGEAVLSEGDMRFALVSRQGFTTWIDELKDRTARAAG